MKLATDTDRTRWLGFVAAQPLPLDVDCKRWRKTRSNEQNHLLFGIYYPPVAEKMGYDTHEVHEWMCGNFFGWVDKRVPKTPRNHEGIESVPFRTTTRNEHGKRDVMSKADFGKFLEMVDRVAAKAGVFIPMQEAA